MQRPASHCPTVKEQRANVPRRQEGVFVVSDASQTAEKGSTSSDARARGVSAAIDAARAPYFSPHHAGKRRQSEPRLLATVGADSLARKGGTALGAPLLTDGVKPFQGTGGLLASACRHTRIAIQLRSEREGGGKGRACASENKITKDTTSRTVKGPDRKGSFRQALCLWPAEKDPAPVTFGGIHGEQRADSSLPTILLLLPFYFFTCSRR